MIFAAILPLIFMAVELAYTEKFNGIVRFFSLIEIFIRGHEKWGLIVG